MVGEARKETAKRGKGEENQDMELAEKVGRKGEMEDRTGTETVSVRER